MVCLDTCFLADLFRKDLEAEQKLLDLASIEEEIVITIITVAELYYGAYKSRKIEEEKLKVKEAIAKFKVFDLNEQSAEEFGRLLSTLDKAGSKVSDRDVLIAAIALSNDEKKIVTRNRRDFGRIPGLTVLTY